MDFSALSWPYPYHAQREVPRSEGDLVTDVLTHVIDVFEPLTAPELLPRYRGVRDANVAGAADLAQAQ